MVFWCVDFSHLQEGHCTLHGVWGELGWTCKEKIILLFPLSLLNMSQADRRLMWPVIHGHAELIPIHLSLAFYELANRPENMSNHTASSLWFILNIFSLLSLFFSPVSLLHIQTRSHCRLCWSHLVVISRFNFFFNSLTLEIYYNSAWASKSTCGHWRIPWGTEACPDWSPSCCHLHHCPCRCHCRWQNRSVGSSHSAACRERQRQEDKSQVVSLLALSAVTDLVQCQNRQQCEQHCCWYKRPMMSSTKCFDSVKDSQCCEYVHCAACMAPYVKQRNCAKNEEKWRRKENTSCFLH